MKKAWLLALILTAILLGGGLWYWFAGRQSIKKEEPLPTFLSEEATQALETAQNPVKKVVETNPFKNQETNPIINLYKNPFE